ncbi:hypothetical protein ACQP25_29330 [Microtetraspora malaysiensis]|uniref:hypothetical protein n=1 Tax=Microtetraspora malaysiensis TaxID=161358 RepID=UPI003D944210
MKNHNEDVAGAPVEFVGTMVLQPGSGSCGEAGDDEPGQQTRRRALIQLARLLAVLDDLGDQTQQVRVENFAMMRLLNTMAVGKASYQLGGLLRKSFGG